MTVLFKKRSSTTKEYSPFKKGDTPSLVVAFDKGYIHHADGVFTLSFSSEGDQIYNADELKEFVKMILKTLAVSLVSMTDIQDDIEEFFNGGGQ